MGPPDGDGAVVEWRHPGEPAEWSRGDLGDFLLEAIRVRGLSPRELYDSLWASAGGEPMIPTELEKILRPPSTPAGVPSGEDWATAENALGLSFPGDYRAFVEGYGAGKVDDFLWILTPVEMVEQLSQAREHEAVIRCGLAEQELLFPPYELHPTVPGLVPVGGTDNGNRIFWLTEGEPSSWPVIVTAPRDLRVERFELPLLDWLAGVLSREITVGLFPEDFPDEEPAFLDGYVLERVETRSAMAFRASKGAEPVPMMGTRQHRGSHVK